jgi:hypothetical protein
VQVAQRGMSSFSRGRFSGAAYNAMPFELALRQSTNWLSALRIMSNTRHLLQGIHTPVAEELTAVLPKLTNPFALILFINHFVLNRSIDYGRMEKEQRLVKSLLLQCAKTDCLVMHSKLYNLFNDKNLITPQQQLVIFSKSADWVKAIAFAVQRPGLMRDSICAATVIRAALYGGQWEMAMSLFVPCWGKTLTAPSLLTRLNTVLCRNNQWNLALRLIANTIAAGSSPHDTLSVFHPVMRNLARIGFWREALEFAVGNGALERLDEEIQGRRNSMVLSMAERREKSNGLEAIAGPGFYQSMRINALTSNLIDVLSLLDYYPEVTEHSVLPLMIARTTSAVQHRPILSASAIRRRLQHITRVIDNNVMLMLPGKKRVLMGTLNQYVPDVPGDTIVLLDTSFVVLCVARGLSIETFREQIRSTHPHMANAPLKSVVSPFRTLIETIHLTERSCKNTRGGIVNMKRVREFFFQSRQLTLLTFTTEVSAGSFYIIQKLYGFADTANPDRHILNIALAFQYEAFLQRFNENKQACVARYHDQLLPVFVNYHLDRLSGNKTGYLDPKLVFVTFDKELSMRADKLGILTYPNFQGEHARSLKPGRL